MYDRREVAFAAFGIIGLIVGAVALVIAIGAKNDANSDQSAQAQAAQALEQQLSDKADALKAGLEQDVKQTGSLQRKAAKAKRQGNKAEKTGQAAASQAAANKRKFTREIAELKKTTDQLDKDVKDLQTAQKSTEQSIREINLKLKLKKNKN